jgi:N-acetylglucosaminyl-diphospho-decaprenol L-rhamnosyltransferase
MIESPDVALVMVNYKSARLTARAIESVAQERKLHPELKIVGVVVENASGDEAALRELLGSKYDDWLTLLISPTNGGFGTGCNLGMKWAYQRGAPPRYFHMLNPDTEVRPHGLAELVKFLDAHPQAGAAGSRLLNEDGSAWPFAFRFPSVWSEVEEGMGVGLVTKLLKQHTIARTMSDLPELVDWVPGASMMARREMVDQIGGFDEEFFLYFEETDWALRASRHGWQTWYVPQSQVMHMAGQSTGVTSQDGPPKRLPAYWFKSRRRFFAKNHPQHATLIDLAFLAANSLGAVKRGLKREYRRPHLVRDFVRHSMQLHRERSVAAERSSLGRSGGS